MKDTLLDSEILDQIKMMAQDGEHLCREVIEIFVSTTPARLKEIDAALADGDLNSASALGHSLKGGAGSLGLVRFAAACQRIEDGVESGNQSARDGLEAATRAFAPSEEALRGYLRRQEKAR